MAGAMAWRQAIEAVLAGKSLLEAAQQYPEFRAAAETGGIRESPMSPWSDQSPGVHRKFAEKNL